MLGLVCILLSLIFFGLSTFGVQGHPRFGFQSAGLFFLFERVNVGADLFKKLFERSLNVVLEGMRVPHYPAPVVLKNSVNV